jgi:hypothetical protein
MGDGDEARLIVSFEDADTAEAGRLARDFRNGLLESDASASASVRSLGSSVEQHFGFMDALIDRGVLRRFW